MYSIITSQHPASGAHSAQGLALPLCLLKNLSSLAPFSLAGIAGMLYTAVAMAFRCFDGSYSGGPDSKFAMDVAESLRPSIGTKGASAVFSSNSFILICMLSTAYMAHFNAAKFYIELENNTIKRWNTVVATSFSISILFFIGIAGKSALVLFYHVHAAVQYKGSTT